MRGNAKRCAERPVVYAPAHWWMITNWGTPIGVYRTQQDCVKALCQRLGVDVLQMKNWRAYEIRKVTVKPTPANRGGKP